MKTKIIVLALMLSLIPAVSQARGYRIPRNGGIAKIARTIKYPYTLHRLTRVRCAYAGCRSDLQP